MAVDGSSLRDRAGGFCTPKPIDSSVGALAKLPSWPPKVNGRLDFGGDSMCTSWRNDSALVSAGGAKEKGDFETNGGADECAPIDGAMAVRERPDKSDVADGKFNDVNENPEDELFLNESEGADGLITASADSVSTLDSKRDALL